ncbi:hypothetical protein GCM10010270_79750 [Streptomyces violaceus]|nr:hypothetical protein GCM10010270_79750 [Streptomyces janthinus]
MDAESAGSYVYRLASANGLECAELLDLVGRGPETVPALGSAELYLDAAALSRLSVLAGYDSVRLQRALPATRPEYLLPSMRSSPCWRWFSRESGRQHLVRACRLCAAVRGAQQTSYVWSDMPWQVCIRHGMWQDDQPEKNAWAPPDDAMAWILQAHRRRLVFERRLGRMGRVLFADAYTALMSWNQRGLTLPGWLVRRQSLDGVDRTSPVLQSVVIYPEAIELAQMFGRYECQRLTGTLNQHVWWNHLAERIWQWNGTWPWAMRNSTDELRKPIDAWVAQHHPSHRSERERYTPSINRRRWTRRRRIGGLPLKEPHGIADRILPLEKVSCLCQPGVGSGYANSLPATETGASRPVSGIRSSPHASSSAHRQWAAPRQGGNGPSERSIARPATIHSTAEHPADTLRGVSESPKAMNLRFPDPQQRAAIEAAAKREGVSMQEYILSAAYAHATAVEQRFLEAFKASMARGGSAFDSQANCTLPDARRRDAEQQALRDLEPP